MRDAALAYTAQGVPVFPVNPENKEPHTKRGFKDATTDEKQIRAWWSNSQWAIGMPTGKITNCFVLDFDPRHNGHLALQAMEAMHGPMPDTRRSKTGGGGWHYFFQYANGFKCSNGEVAEGVDIKTDGGYVILPPSPHFSGETYQWINDGRVLTATEWLLDLCRSTNKKKPRGDRTSDRKIREGQRNDYLTSRAGEMRRLGFDLEAITAALLAENSRYCDPRLPEREVQEIAESVSRYEPALAVDFTDLPRVVVEAGRQSKALDQAELILVKHAAELRVFQRGGILVRIVEIAKPQKLKRVEYPSGTILLDGVDCYVLMETLERLMRFEKDDVTINCPGRMARMYLQRRCWKLPVLHGFISAPIMRPNGSILYEPGYDPETGLYLTGNGNWLPVPTNPMKQEVDKAVETVRKPFSEFPFETPADEAVVHAAALTAIQRRMLPACPAFFFSAPAPRTGKTYLAKSIAIIATGKPAAACTASPVREEMRKAITSILLASPAVINFDNLTYLESEDLCKAITEEEFQDRVLGHSQIVVLPTNVLWTGTGNNLSIRGDLTQRALMCRINANCEHPEERKFQKDFLAHCTEKRTELVHAYLTILHGYSCAGRPDLQLPGWGGFDEWSDLIRSALVWCGFTDPCTTRNAIVEDDPIKQNAVTVLANLQRVFGSNVTFTAKDAVQHPDVELQAALLAVAKERKGKDIDTGNLGRFLRSWKERIAGGLQLRKTERNDTAEWFIVKAQR
jgi:putative DNA primase/helicase